MIIGDSRMARILDAAAYAAGKCPGPWRCDHGHLIVERGNGRLLASGVAFEGATAMRLAQHMDPATVEELMRGYAIAKVAGLL